MGPCRNSLWRQTNAAGYPINTFQGRVVVHQLWILTIDRYNQMPGDRVMELDYLGLEQRGFVQLCGNRRCIEPMHIRLNDERKEPPMFEALIKLYTAAMMFDVRSPMPHLVGPAGCGKSTSVEQLADVLGVDLHIINVSRLSPLELEGVQMPHGHGDEMILKMLTATFWTQLKEGDILLLDEFLRGFPEVYNGLLDIFTSRRVGSYRLPKVFIIGASNSVVAYDQALEDRLLHLAVPDPRKKPSERTRLQQIFVEAVGLHPDMVGSVEMGEMMDEDVLPMYSILDSFKKSGSKVGATSNGVSLRNLIGQAQLRLIQSNYLANVLSMNNRLAMNRGTAQYVVLPDGKSTSVPSRYLEEAGKLKGNPKLTEIQALNLEMNLQLIEMQAAIDNTEVP